MESNDVLYQRRAIKPGSLAIKWNIGATQYQLTDNGAGGLTGHGSGTVAYYGGQIEASPNPAPRPSDGPIEATFTQWSGTAKESETVPPFDGNISHTVANGPIKPGTVYVTAKVIRQAEVIHPLNGGQQQSSTTTADAIAHDNGSGNLLRNGVTVGTVNYATGAVTFDLRQPYVYQVGTENVTTGTMGGGAGYRYTSWTQTNGNEVYAASNIAISYARTTDPEASVTVNIQNPGLTIELLPGRRQPVVPGSVLFTLGGKTYRDVGGAIITDWSSTTNAGTSVGAIDYSTGVVTLTDWPAGVNANSAVVVNACLLEYGERTAYTSSFRAAGAPLRAGSLTVKVVAGDGEQITVTAGTNGSLDHAAIEAGFVDIETGSVDIIWAKAIFPGTLTYSTVAYTFLPLDASLIGLDPTRLPSDGRVPIVQAGDVGVISHTATTAVANPTPGGFVQLARDHIAEAWVVGANGKLLRPESYTVNREAGRVTWADPLVMLDASGAAVTTPLTIHDRIEDMSLITDVAVSGLLKLNSPLSRDYPANSSVFSSAVLHGDLRARVFNLFHQAAWTSVWNDARIGNDTTAKYNDLTYPIEITNQGSIKERWLVKFTSGVNFDVVGETVGVVAQGNVSSDTAVTNPATGAPYFRIRKEGWGAGWVSGNCLRFNTDGAQAPFWIARTIIAGPATEEEDSFTTQNRGDAD